MMEENKDNTSKKKSSRRDFLKLGIGLGGASLLTLGGASLLANEASKTTDGEESIKLLTPDGKLVEVPKSAMKQAAPVLDPATREAARKGIPNRKFVMVIDLAKCKNARKCTEACQHGHHLPSHHEWMKIYLMQSDESTSPYWMPKNCFHCDNPMCVSVCPVGATYKRSDGIVLVDNERCIGCKFCMTGCPYSARVFNWKHYKEHEVNVEYSPETNVPGKEGTVGKCVFCADIIKNGELPRCVTACPMGVLYFGDMVEDTVSNGDETLVISELIKKRAGYRHLEELGTLPSVYYLPPVDRQFPVEKGLEDQDEEVKHRYDDEPFVKSKGKKTS